MLDFNHVNFKSKCLMTGASGFIGRQLLEFLFKYGVEINTFDRQSNYLTFPVKQYVGDLRDADLVEACVEQSNPEIIFHLAAFKERSSKLEDFSTAIDTNLIGALNLFKAAARLNNLRSIVIVGTAEEYGRNVCPFTESMREAPVSAYSFSKLCLTHLCEVLHNLYKIPFTVVRPTLAYGPGQPADMFLPALIKSLISNKQFPMTPGEQTRDFVYISDLVDALVSSALNSKAVGQIINIGSGMPVSISELALRVQRLLNKTNLVRTGDIDYRSGEIMDYYVDITKAKNLLGWTPKVSLDVGLKKTIDYYLQGD
jgi:UDP-glucose 4-epimerase